MRIIIKREKASSILHNGKFYDTGKELDVSFSEAMRLAKVAKVDMAFDSADYDPSLWKNEKFINFTGDIDDSSGFGGVSQNLIKFSYPEVKTAHVGKVFGVHDNTVLAARNRPLNQSGAMIWHDQPRESWLYSPFKRNVAIVPWETTVIPASWIGKINSFDALLVPCTQNIEAFRSSGVTVPIELIHWGIDETIFYPLERPERPVFTFGHFGALSIRKGTDILISAFLEAFPNEKDVRLLCKTSYNNYPFGVKDKRIVVKLGQWPREDVISMFYKETDCFVFPTRGEGFGLTPLEAMATGIPSIVTGWSGPDEYMNFNVGWIIDHTFSPAKNFSDVIYKEECGDWAEPSKEHLIELMRYAYNHRDEVKEKGKNAAEYVKNNWLWKQKIGMYVSALGKHL
jgi:glycosyltransferase involved in cell wall biosynthesis